MNAFRPLAFVAVLLSGGCATANYGVMKIIGGNELSLQVEAAVLKDAIVVTDAPLAATTLEEHTATSEHVVVVKDREPFHKHDKSDLVGILLEGEGYFKTLHGDVPVAVGDVIVIPMGAPHAFVNTASGYSTVFATFSPPFTAGDRVAVDEPSYAP